MTDFTTEISVLIGDGTARHVATLRDGTYGTLCLTTVDPYRVTSVLGAVTCKRCLAAMRKAER